VTGRNGDEGSWIRRFHETPEQPVRVVLLPHAGGSASFFFPFSRELSERADVLAVQYPGRQDRLAEPCVDNVEGLAGAVHLALKPWLDRPVVLFGHSLGATVAFEVAARLEREDGFVPRSLVVSGRRAPGEVRRGTTHLLDDDGLLSELSELSGTDQAVLADPDLRRMILPAVRADYKAAETYVYRPGPPLRCPILSLVGNDDPRASVDEARAWNAYTTGPFELETFPGGHFYLAEPEQRAGVLAALARTLAG